MIVLLISHHLIPLVDGDHKATRCSGVSIIALAVNGTLKVGHLHVHHFVQAVNKFQQP